MALLARRRPRIEAAAKEAGSTTVAIECDVTDEESCRAAINDAADALGGIDALIYTPAIGPLVRMVDTDAETWRRVFDTNVIGAALATAAARKAVYLSSDAGPFGPPWPGLGAYGVSKAALEQLVDAWRAEYPDIGFTCLIVGECGGGEGDAATGMNVGWDMDLAMKAVPLCCSRGCLPGKLMPVVVARGAPAGPVAFPDPNPDPSSTVALITTNEGDAGWRGS